MKKLKIFTILFIVFVLFVTLTACSNDKNSTVDTDTQQQSEAAQSSVQDQTSQTAVVSQAVPTVDPKASADSLIGSWNDINSSDLFANITKTDTGYQYEDNDGKYAATFKDGVLKVEVAEGQTADVYFDAATSHMFLVFQDNTSEFVKKQ